MRKEINDFDVNSRRVVWGGCTVYWAAYIYGLSAQTAEESSELSSGLTERILRFFYLEFDKLTPEVQQSLVDAMHSGIRKAAHMFLYAVFAALVYLFVRTYFEKRNTVAVISLGVCLFYSAADEYHQTLVAGRAGMARDVIIDLNGAIIGLLFLFLFFKCIGFDDFNHTEGIVKY